MQYPPQNTPVQGGVPSDYMSLHRTNKKAETLVYLGVSAFTIPLGIKFW